MLIPFQQLFRRYGVKPDGVLHLGANTGQEAEVYQSFKIPHVIWVEAIPSVFEKLCHHLDRYPLQWARQACVSDTDGETVDFNIASNDAQSSSFLEFGTHSKEHPTVKYTGKIQLKTVRVDTLLRGICLKGKWFLNIDLQGAELKALSGMGKLLQHFEWAYIEVNREELYKGCPMVQEIDSFLSAWGFVGAEVKWTGNGWGDKFYIKP